MFRKTIAALVLTAGLMGPAVASASGLSALQVNAVIGLLQAFNIEEAVVAHVRDLLTAAPAEAASVAQAVSSIPQRVPVTDSVYKASNIGYDLSYATHNYPQIPFNFAIVGVNGGKAFEHNTRFKSEFSWAQFGDTGPTIYMNLNAPYGSHTVGNVSAPKTCATTASETGGEPTACEGYNFGYNAAKDAYAYAGANAEVPIWWLDIEEANSWSHDVSVNDAAIQGAIDYLNSKGQRVGIYSVAYMWEDIAGKGFTPTQTIYGKDVSIPTWFPIGVATRVQAANACVIKRSFIPGSPIWLLQHLESSRAVDQGYAC